MFRKLVIAVITAWAALLETVADAIEATLPPPAADSPRLRVVAPGRLCLRLLIVSPPPCRPSGNNGTVSGATWSSCRSQGGSRPAYSCVRYQAGREPGVGPAG